jgi:hypothetical protein
MFDRLERILWPTSTAVASWRAAKPENDRVLPWISRNATPNGKAWFEDLIAGRKPYGQPGHFMSTDNFTGS